jgi:hypothetical protein
MRPLNHTYFIFSLLTAAAAPLFAQGTLHKEISRGHEKELFVTIDVSFGKVFISQGEASKIVIADVRAPREADPDEFQIDYRIRGDRGELVVRSKERRGFWKTRDNDDEEDREWTLKFTDAIPITFKIELGAGKGELDLSGLQIKNMKVSSGASAVEMFCDTPNPIDAESIVIESGVSKFTATNLNNTNFRKLKFSGGVGAYKLDFGGKLRQDADAKIEVGLGAVTVILPGDVQARVLYSDSWFSSFDLDGDFSHRRSGVYETTGYTSSNPTISIQIESGLGSVRVRRRD